MIIKNKAKPRTPTIEPGVYPAVCCGVVDIGEQYSEKFKTYSNKVRIVWALPSETIEREGKVEERQLSRTFTIATKANCNLRKTIEAWIGTKFSDEAFEEFDLLSLIGRPCFLNVVLSDSGEYSNIESVIPLPKGTPAPTSTTAPIIWDMAEWSDEGFEDLPEWAQDEIKKSTEWQTIHVPVTDVQIQTAPTAQAPVQAAPQPVSTNYAAALGIGNTAPAPAAPQASTRPTTGTIPAGSRGGLPF